MSRNRRFGDEGGFSLLETLLASAISAMVMGAVVASIFMFNRLSIAQQDSLSVSHQMQQATSMLNHDVVSASSGTISEEGDDRSLSLLVPEYVYGASEEPVTKTVSYDYAADAGTLTRDEGSGAMEIARHLSSLDFGPSGEISTTVRITVGASRGDSVKEARLILYRRVGP